MLCNKYDNRVRLELRNGLTERHIIVDMDVNLYEWNLTRRDTTYQTSELDSCKNGSADCYAILHALEIILGHNGVQ